MGLSLIKTILTSMTTTITGSKKKFLPVDMQANKWYRFHEFQDEIKVSWNVYSKPDIDSSFHHFTAEKMFMFIQCVDDMVDPDRPYTTWMHVGIDDVFGYVLVYNNTKFCEVTEQDATTS